MYIARPTTLTFQALMALILAATFAVLGLQGLPGGAWLGVLPLLVIGGYAVRKPLRRWRATRQRFPEAWHRQLCAVLPFYAGLEGAGQQRFQQDIQIYLSEQRFEGVEGVDVTDDLRLLVATGAALLLHGRPDWDLSTRRTVLFYPGRFDEDYYDTYAADFDGMVHEQGPIIFSAAAVRQGWANPRDGSNVVLHELAHLLDFDNAYADGQVARMGLDSVESWQALVEHEMRRVRQRRSILRPYAATNRTEFFAVAVEVFFERPEALHQAHRRLFDALAAFFNLDPRSGVLDA